MDERMRKWLVIVLIVLLVLSMGIPGLMALF